MHSTQRLNHVGTQMSAIHISTSRNCVFLPLGLCRVTLLDMEHLLLVMINDNYLWGC